MPSKDARAGRVSKVELYASLLLDTYPGRGMHQMHWQACASILQRVFQSRHGNLLITTSLSRNLANLFRQLPDEQKYADYYEAIPEPEALDNVATQLSEGSYLTAAAFFKQLHLVFLNAKHYNEEESQIWIDACFFEHLILDAWRDKAHEGVFANPDPYFQPPRRGRPPKNSDQPASIHSPRTSVMNTEPQLQNPFPVVQPSATMPLRTSRSRSPSAQPYISAASPTASDTIRRHDQTESDRQIVAALDTKLPRWPGPQAVLAEAAKSGNIDGSGWWGEGAPDFERGMGGETMWPDRVSKIIGGIRGYQDPSGKRLSDAFATIPAVSDIPYLSFHAPLSFSSIQSNASSHRYRSLRDFDVDMTHLFEKARRFHLEGSTEYGHVLVLQRLYNALTAPYPLTLPPSGEPEPSPTLFASLPAGPGNARSLHETTQEIKAGASEEDVGFGVTTFRVGTKDRVFTDEARHKGMAYRVGDYVHLINPDDSTRPIIGQVFKTFVPTKGYRTHHLTVCWYYRPEQTVHAADRLFFEREVFKSGHFCDHPVQDVLERVSCQFYVKYIRGRPQAGEFYPGWPSYICNSRYNDREWHSVRIKNWGSCIPDELRQTDFMSIVPYERHLEPPMVKSPFRRGITGPGFVGEPKSKPTGEEDEEFDEPAKRISRPADRQLKVIPTPPQNTVILPSTANRPRDSRSSMPGPSQLFGQLPTVTNSTPNRSALPRVSQRSTTGGNHGIQTIGATLDGAQVMDQIAAREVLPSDTVRLFERDARQQVLWFSGPPLAPGTVHVPIQPSHSIEYLEYLTKRKRDMIESEQPKPKRGSRSTVAPAVVRRIATLDSEETGDVDMSAVWWAQGMSAEQVADILRAIIGTA